MSEHVEHRIEALLDGELHGAEEQQVREHCAACASCGEQLESSQQLRALIAEDADFAAAGSVWPDVAARIEHSRSPAVRFAGAVAVAACLVMGVTLGIWFGGSTTQESADEDLWAALGSTLTQQESPWQFDEEESP